MRRRNRLLALIATVAVGAAATGVVASSSSSSSPPERPAAAPAAAGFTPKSIAGKWSGKWTNVTFGSTGPIRANVRATGKKLVAMVDFGGNVFGCPDPAAEAVSLPKGRGANRWSSSGFRVKKPTKAFGALDLVYNHSRKSFKGSGKNPPCSPGVSWTLAGKLTAKALSATVQISLPGGAKATAKLSAKKL